MLTAPQGEELTGMSATHNEPLTSGLITAEAQRRVDASGYNE